MTSWHDDELDNEEPRSIARVGRPRRWPAILAGVTVVGLLALAAFIFREVTREAGAPRMPLQNPNPRMVWPALPQVDYEPDLGVWPAPGDVARTLEIPGDTRDAVFPATPSPFVLLQGDRDSRLVNLQTWEQTVWQRPFHDMHSCLSPDGKHYATVLNETVVVFAIGDQPKEVRRFAREAGPHHHIMPFAFAGPDRVVVGDGNVMEVFDLKKKELAPPMRLESGPFHTFADGADTGQTSAVSPNGRNLAILGQSREITIYDLQERGIAARLRVPAKGDLMHCIGVAFSRDGKRMACAVQHWPKGELFVFDIRKAELLQTIPFKGMSTERHRVGEGLEWLPDDSGWLVGGAYLIDAKQEVTLWQSPRWQFIDGWREKTVPRLLGPWHLTALKRHSLSLHPLPKADIDELRAAHPIEKGKTLRLQAPKEAAAYQGRVDAVPVSIPLPASIPLREAAADLVRILFSQGDAPRVVVLEREYAVNPLERVIPLHACVYDLKSGQAQSRFKLCDAPAKHWIVHHPAADIDPAATILAFVNPETPRRLDIWTLDGKQLHSWIPYADGLDEITRVFALSEARVLTLSKLGRLTLWNLADKTPVFQAENVDRKIALSATRKYLAIGGANGVELFETASGAFKGRLSLPFKQNGNVHVLGFTPDGTRFLAHAHEMEKQEKGKENRSQGERIIVWELENGVAVRHFPIQGLFGQLSITNYWCGRDFMLSDFGKLIDFNCGTLIWEYQLASFSNGMHFGGLFPDQRLWTLEPQPVSGAPFGKQPGAIRPIAMPTPAALTLSESIAKLPDARPIALTGGGYRFSVEMEGPKDRVASVMDELKRSAFTPGLWPNEESKKSLVLKVDGAATVTIRDDDGTVLWTHTLKGKADFTTLGNEVHFIPWPNRVMRGGEKVIALPGRTKLVP